MKINFLVGDYLLSAKPTGVQTYFRKSMEELIKEYSSNILVTVFPGFRKNKQKLRTENFANVYKNLRVVKYFRRFWAEKIIIPFFYKKRYYLYLRWFYSENAERN